MSEKISREVCKEGSAKEGEETGLRGGDGADGGMVPGNGGKYESMKREGVTG